MDISLIIPAFNASKTVAACLQACRAQKLPPEARLQIILVDDGSTDSTSQLAEGFGVQVVAHPRQRGAAAARNSGLAAATGEIILFTDADCVPQENWVMEMIRPFANPAIMGCKGIYTTRQPQLVARFVQIEYEDKYDLLRTQPFIDFIDTYSAGYRAAVLRDCGGFDEAVQYVEDQELSFRLAAAGHKMVFQSTAVVAHKHSDTVWRYLRKKVMIGYWKSQIMRRYPDRIIKDSHTPQVMKLQMGLAALVLATLAAGIIWPLFLVISLATIVLFFLTTLPFLQKAWGKDRAVCLASPFLLFVRAFALGLGYAWGILRPRPIH